MLEILTMEVFISQKVHAYQISAQLDNIYYDNDLLIGGMSKNFQTWSTMILKVLLYNWWYKGHDQTTQSLRNCRKILSHQTNFIILLNQVIISLFSLNKKMKSNFA